MCSPQRFRLAGRIRLAPSVFRKPGFLNRVGEPMSNANLNINLKSERPENRGVQFLVGVIAIAVFLKWWFTGTVFFAFQQTFSKQAFAEGQGFSPKASVAVSFSFS